MSGHELVLILYGAVSALYLRREIVAARKASRDERDGRRSVTVDERKEL